MFKRNVSIFLFVLAIFVPLANADEMAPNAFANFQNTDGEMIGTAKLWQGSGGVLILVELQGLSPGAHAIHIHSRGACEPDFKASKGHINIHDKAHGLLNPDGPDNGDLPNIYVGENGSVTAEMYTTAVAVIGDSAAMLFDEDGSALVVHENSDDHVTQPIGGAGGRVACGVIEK